MASAKKRNHRSLARWFRRGFVLILGLAVAGAVVLAWMPRPPRVEIAIVEEGVLTVTVDEDGRARVKDRHVVSAPLAGSLARIDLDPGESVRQGDVLARIVPLMPPLLDQRARTGAEAQVSASLAVQGQARAQIERARAGVEFAKTDAARQRSLFESSAISAAQLEPALLAERTTAAELESLRFGARVADYEVEMARAALRRLTAPRSGDDGDQLELPSPITGRVLKVLHENEGVVQAGTPLLEVGDPNALEIAVDVLTSDAVRVGPGAVVTIDRWGGAPLEGRVRRVDPSAFTRLSALGVEEQRVDAIVDVVSAHDLWRTLGDGYRVEAHIVVWRAEHALKVPASAVFRRGPGWVVFRVDGDVARLVSVEVGERTTSAVEVRKGLRAGDRLIVHPADSIADGVRVVER